MTEPEDFVVKNLIIRKNNLMQDFEQAKAKMQRIAMDCAKAEMEIVKRLDVLGNHKSTRDTIINLISAGNMYVEAGQKTNAKIVVQKIMDIQKEMQVLDPTFPFNPALWDEIRSLEKKIE